VHVIEIGCSTRLFGTVVLKSLHTHTGTETETSTGGQKVRIMVVKIHEVL
jgi:hypothetical protein